MKKHNNVALAWCSARCAACACASARTCFACCAARRAKKCFTARLVRILYYVEPTAFCCWWPGLRPQRSLNQGIRPVKTKPSVPGSARLFADSHPFGAASREFTSPILTALPRKSRPFLRLRMPWRCATPVVNRGLELAKNIGRETNNVAEYFALLAALDYATSHNIPAAQPAAIPNCWCADAGALQRKARDLKPLYERAAKTRARQLQYFAIEHAPRTESRCRRTGERRA